MRAKIMVSAPFSERQECFNFLTVINSLSNPSKPFCSSIISSVLSCLCSMKLIIWKNGPKIIQLSKLLSCAIFHNLHEFIFLTVTYNKYILLKLKNLKMFVLKIIWKEQLCCLCHYYYLILSEVLPMYRSTLLTPRLVYVIFIFYIYWVSIRN